MRQVSPRPRETAGSPSFFSDQRQTSCVRAAIVHDGNCITQAGRTVRQLCARMHCVRARARVNARACVCVRETSGRLGYREQVRGTIEVAKTAATNQELPCDSGRVSYCLALRS